MDRMRIYNAPIMLKSETREELRSRGRKGETYDYIISELLKKDSESSNVGASDDHTRRK
jgi:hypothetical protein